MKIFFNARLFQHRITGVQRYAIELLKTFDLLIDRGEIGLGDSSLIMLAPAKVKSSLCFKHLQFRQVGLLHGHLWEQIELPFYARNGLLVNLCNTAPLFKRNQIVTIHDAAVFANPKTYSFLFLLWYKMLLRRIGQMSKRIITVSAFSKKELHRYCHIPLAKMQVIYEGSEHLCSQSTDDTILRKHNLRPNSYLLAVSSIKKNKNFHSLMQAIDFLPDHELEIVIAGARDCKIYDNKYTALPKNIKYVGYVCDSELRALYENAAFFVYPSFYEGFGLPPIEAMACGCPVIVSNAASLPEVCGNAALYVDPQDPQDIAAKIQILINDRKLRERLREKSLKHAKKFSWDRAAKETVSIIKQLVQQ